MASQIPSHSFRERPLGSFLEGALMAGRDPAGDKVAAWKRVFLDESLPLSLPFPRRCRATTGMLLLLLLLLLL
jgi:hypothetical protein